MKQPELIIEDLKPQDRPVAATVKELRALADDIHTNGLKHPILVMDDIVVDGLKRIEAFKLLGRARIPALVTTNYGEATHFLTKVREGAPVEPPRNVEIVEQLDQFRLQYHKMRYYPKMAKANKSAPWGQYSSRQLMARALGCAESYAEAIILLTRAADTDPELTRRLALVKKGQDTIHGAYQAYRRRKVREEFAQAPAEEIRTTTTRGFQTLETTLTAMSKYGTMLSLPREERVTMLLRAEELRRQLYYFTKGLKEGLTIEAKEGQEG